MAFVPQYGSRRLITVITRLDVPLEPRPLKAEMTQRGREGVGGVRGAKNALHHKIPSYNTFTRPRKSKGLPQPKNTHIRKNKTEKQLLKAKCYSSQVATLSQGWSQSHINSHGLDDFHKQRLNACDFDLWVLTSGEVCSSMCGWIAKGCFEASTISMEWKYQDN